MTLDEIAEQLSGQSKEVRKLVEMLHQARADIAEASQRALSLEYALRAIDILNSGESDENAG